MDITTLEKANELNNKINELQQAEKTAIVGFKNHETYISKINGHQFKVGEKLKLIGLESFPEHNGKEVEITNYREEDLYGRCYYIKGAEEIMQDLNWVYEYRLTRAGCE